MKTYLSLISILLLCNSISSQSKYTNATYSTGLTRTLSSTTTYPKNALEGDMKGDVVLSFVIDKQGGVKDLKVVSSPSQSLTSNSLISFSNLDGDWSPGTENGIKIDKEYLIIYRYLIQGSDSKTYSLEKAEKYFNKKKYDKALKYYDKAIKNNAFVPSLFEGRAKTKEQLGDLKGSKEDFQQANLLNSKLLGVIDVLVLKQKVQVEYRVEYKQMNN